MKKNKQILNTKKGRDFIVKELKQPKSKVRLIIFKNIDNEYNLIHKKGPLSLCEKLQIRIK